MKELPELVRKVMRGHDLSALQRIPRRYTQPLFDSADIDLVD